MNYFSEMNRFATMGYFVRAVWDADNAIYISDSNVPGLHIEATTLEQFKEAVHDMAGELLAANVPSGNYDDTKSVPLTFSCREEQEMLIELT